MTVSSGPRGEVFQRSPIVPITLANPVLRNTRWLLMETLGLRNYENASQDHSRSFHSWHLRESNWRPPTSQVGKSPNVLFEDPILSRVFVSLFGSLNALYICLGSLHQLLNYSSKLGCLGAVAYQLGNTSSRTITEVKQC